MGLFNKSQGDVMPSYKNILEDIDTNIKGISQEAISSLNRENFEKEQFGSLMARAGARVFSVEGDSWEEGLNNIDNRGFLGYFVKADEMIAGWRVWFDKTYYFPGTKRPLPKSRRIKHPLSVNGYYVPREGGINVVDNGKTIYLSRTGIFSGQGGWSIARKYRKDVIECEIKYQQLSDHNQHTTSQLNHMETALLRQSVSKDDMVIQMMKYQTDMINARDTVVHLRGNMLSLQSQLESITSIKGHQEHVIKTLISQCNQQLNDISAFVMNERIFQALTLAGSKAPDVTDKLVQKMKEGWEKRGIIPEDKVTKELQEIRERSLKQDQQLKDLKEELERKMMDTSTPPKMQEQQLEERVERKGETKSEEQPPEIIKTRNTPPKTIREKAQALGQDVKNGIIKATQLKPKEEEKQEEPKNEDQPPQEEQGDDQEEEQEETQEEGGDENP